jgi:deoxycytidylate deaminase
MLQRIDNPELFFGLVAPIGVDLSETVKYLEAALKVFGYDTVPIKVTDLFREIDFCDVELQDKPSEQRFKTYIAFGNRVRELTGDQAICAALVIDKIARSRPLDQQGKPNPGEKRAFIVHQFKRKEEIDLLRSVYGRLFFQISVYSSRGERSDAFSQRIARDHKSTDLDRYKPQADELIKLDEDQEDHEHGQRIREVFHLADFIINKDIATTQRDQLDRFVELIFGKNTLSPSKIEYGMYMAKAASLRSLDLSRQVGAAIFSRRNEVVTLGCNEVPKGGGGTYWSDDDTDARDYKWENAPNDERKRSLVLDFLERLEERGLLPEGCIERVDEIMQQKPIKDALLMDIIEFGRIVHAEMSAIIDAARLGRAVQDCTLYCTTFPCHICAKHIAAAGIEKVYFLEPYPKSAAFSLHPDSIEVEGSSRVHFKEFKKTEFIHFHGISPRRYRDFFERSRRKDKAGKAQEWMFGSPKPILDVKLPVYTALEVYVQKALKLSVDAARKRMAESTDLFTASQKGSLSGP